MTIRRLVVSTAIGLLVGIGSWIAYGLANPPSYELAFPVSANAVRMRFTPSHPYLAEYDTSVVFTNQAGRVLAANVFPDTGGYARHQLYSSADGKFYLEGYFDVAVLDPASESINVGSHQVPEGAKYLGAIDVVSREGPKVFAAEQSPRQRLIAKDGDAI